MLGLHILWILLLLLPSNLNSNIASDGGRLSLPGTRAGSCAMARVTHLLLRLAWSWQYSASTNARWHKLPQSQSEFKFWLQASVAPLYGLGLWPHYVTRLSPGPACRAWRQGRAARRAGLVAARDSSRKYIPQGVKFLSSVTTEKAAGVGISIPFYAKASAYQKVGPATGRELWRAWANFNGCRANLAAAHESPLGTPDCQKPLSCAIPLMFNVSWTDFQISRS